MPDAQPALVARPTLLERERELVVLTELVAGVRAGRGALVLVEGPAGIGKTGLLTAVRQLAATAGLEVLPARGSELEREFSYGMVRQLFEPRLASAAPDERRELLSGAAALAARLFAEDALAEADGAGADVTFATLHGLFWLTANLAAESPLLLVLDDLHWGDAASLRWLAYLGRRLEGLPVLIVAALRPAEPGADAALLAEVASDPNAVVLRPAALSRDAVALLVRGELGLDADDPFCDACYDASGGNPLLLQQLLGALQGEGVQPRGSEAHRVQGIGAGAVSRFVQLRLMRLPPAATALARAVAVLGDGVELARAAGLAGLEHADAADAAGLLSRVGIFRRETPLGFAHPLVRSAVYDDLTGAERQHAHARAARLLADSGAAAEEIAAHLLLAPRAGDRAVVETLREAAQLAVARGAPENAATYLRRALDEPPPDALRAAVLFELGIAERRLDAPVAVERLAEAVAFSADPVQAAQASLEYGRALWFANRPIDAADVFSDAVARLGDAEPDLKERLESEIIFSTRQEPKLHRIGLAQAEQVRKRQLHGGIGTHLLVAELSVEQSFTGRGRERAVDLAKQALAGGSLLREGSVAFYNAVNALMFAGEFELARRLYNEAIDEARQRGDLFNVGGMLGFHGCAALLMGDLLDAEADLHEALEISEARGMRAALSYHCGTLAEVLVERGELDEAAGVLSLVELEPQGVVSGHFFNTVRATGIVLLARGEPELALAAATRLGESMAAIEMEHPGYMPWRSQAASALTALGRIEEARAVGREGVAVARRWGAPHAVGVALRTLGLAEGGEEGERLLRESVDVLAKSSARLEHAKALVELGAALRRSNRRADAREPLRQGLEAATICHATPLAKRAETELLATGARPRRIALRGVESLTVSERRVAGMAAEGKTNREIAQALFVTAKTVEVHLSSTYRKLGISSRSQLPAALEAPAEAPDLALRA
jgi:DNA-binding CsgD family transcriptional regulator/tetratricopeptide (TPR) repeat protein